MVFHWSFSGTFLGFHTIPADVHRLPVVPRMEPSSGPLKHDVYWLQQLRSGIIQSLVLEVRLQHLLAGNREWNSSASDCDPGGVHPCYGYERSRSAILHGNDVHSLHNINGRGIPDFL